MYRFVLGDHLVNKVVIVVFFFFFFFGGGGGGMGISTSSQCVCMINWEEL